MNVLEDIDTTVTVEWSATRSIGTLTQLGGRVAVVTALRAPPEGTSIFLRVEAEGQQDGIALDGICVAVTDSEWGEQQLEVDLQRVGTTASATVLRDFIERHGIDRGGSVSIGKNRDNPDLKRYVYTLPELGKSAAGGLRDAAEVLSPAYDRAARPISAAGIGPGPLTQPDEAALDARAPPPEATRFVAAVAETRATSMPETRVTTMPRVAMPSQQVVAVGLTPARRGFGDTEPDDAATHMLDVPVRDDADFELDDFRTDESEPIVVQTVAKGISIAQPVLQRGQSRESMGGASLMRRLLGGLRPDKRAPAPPPVGQPQPPVAKGAADPPGRPSLPAASATEAVLGQRDRSVSHSMQSVQALFAQGQAVRADRPVMFDSGKKKHEGFLQRLGEFKLRVRASYAPQMYERISVIIKVGDNPKDTMTLTCDVTRVRPPDGESPEGSFDARMSSNNSATTMVRLRALMVELGGPNPSAS